MKSNFSLAFITVYKSPNLTSIKSFNSFKATLNLVTFTVTGLISTETTFLADLAASNP